LSNSRGVSGLRPMQVSMPGERPNENAAC